MVVIMVNAICDINNQTNYIDMYINIVDFIKIFPTIYEHVEYYNNNWHWKYVNTKINILWDDSLKNKAVLIKEGFEESWKKSNYVEDVIDH